jgi:hypothetical protein
MDTFTGNSFNTDMPTLWLLFQLSKDYNDFIFKLDGVPPHFHTVVWNNLNAFPEDGLVMGKPTRVVQMATEITRISSM